MDDEERKVWGLARRMTQDKVMLPHQADVLAKLLPDEVTRGCAHKITIRWDQWVEARITCFHGEVKAVSDWFNMTEALLRAAERFKALDHTAACMEDDEEAEDEPEAAHSCPDCSKEGGHRCPDCGHATEYQVFSGGREFYCRGCKLQGTYPADAPKPRAALLQTAEGRDELRDELKAELARRRRAAPKARREGECQSL
jgi:hypothetical protein